MLTDPTRNRREHRIGEGLGVNRHEALDPPQSNDLGAVGFEGLCDQVPRYGGMLKDANAFAGQGLGRQDVAAAFEISAPSRFGLVARLEHAVGNGLGLERSKNAPLVFLADLAAGQIEFEAIAICWNVAACDHDGRAALGYGMEGQCRGRQGTAIDRLETSCRDGHCAIVENCGARGPEVACEKDPFDGSVASPVEMAQEGGGILPGGLALQLIGQSTQTAGAEFEAGSKRHQCPSPA
ncbi:hypothetical protein D3C87_1356350 [compost metagenome]